MMSFSADASSADVEIRAVLFILLGAAFIDGTFDQSERALVRDIVDQMVERRAAEVLGSDPSTHGYAVARWKAHYFQVMTGIEHEIRAYFTESVPEGETTASFFISKLKLRCLELFGHIAKQNRLPLLAAIASLIRADGVVSPSEARLHDDILALVQAAEAPHPAYITEAASLPPSAGQIVFEPPRAYPLRAHDHVFFRADAQSPSGDVAELVRNAESDIELMRAFGSKIRQRAAEGRGLLEGATTFVRFANRAPFLDGHVHVVPPTRGKAYELLVVGDLHGCYSCLKAALLQVDFFGKLERYRSDPQRSPNILAVFLGDFIDRGLRSYDGVLRTLLRLSIEAPGHVYMLRGNHEHYFERHGRVLSPVQPAEAIESIGKIAPHRLLCSYMTLFDLLPNILVFGTTMFVHGGIPREETIATKLSTLAGLNAPEVRFQMVWSDPSDADWVPPELQRNNARFGFGRHQFQSFMATRGCRLMVRGHERIVEGFRRIYSEPGAGLVSLFSSGGATNTDLPATSNYREVTPMALHMMYQDETLRITPFAIAYERFC
jgi:uncharacterized tellurite resistance protein B-like protein